MTKRWILMFSAGSIVLAALLGLAIWLIVGSVDATSDADPALGFNALAAMAVGLVLTTALGVGLMALVFYSARSGADDRSTIDPHAPDTQARDATPQR